MRTKDLKSSKAITLIALVVTIIVLLILAGISIAALTGDNGILTNASKTSTQNAYKGAEEQVKIAFMAVKTEIMAQTTKNGTYNPASPENTPKLANIVRKDLGLAEGATNSNGTWKVEENTEEGVIKIEYKDSKIDKEVIGTTSLTQLNGTTVQIAVPREEGYVHYQINLLDTQDAKLFLDVASDGGDDSGVTYAANSVHTLAQAGTIQRWDRVNYNPGNATTASIELPKGATIEGTKLASLNLPAGASLGGTISASSATDWVVLDVDQTTGEVLIMPRTFSYTELALEGKDGYNNSIEALDAVASIYKNDTYAKSSRSLRVEDVNKVMGHTPDGTVDEQTRNHRYGMDSTTLDITDTGSDSNTPLQIYASTATTGFYCYDVSKIFGSNRCWLASRTVTLGPVDCCFGLRVLDRGVMGHYFTFVVNFIGDPITTYAVSLPVTPVVSLKSGIQLTSAKTFYTETATATATVATQDATHTFEHNEWNLSPATN